MLLSTGLRCEQRRGWNEKQNWWKTVSCSESPLLLPQGDTRPKKSQRLEERTAFIKQEPHFLSPTYTVIRMGRTEPKIIESAQMSESLSTKTVSYLLVTVPTILPFNLLSS